MWEFFFSLSFSSVFREQTVLRNYMKQVLSCAHVKIRLEIVLDDRNHFHGADRKRSIVL